MPFWLQHITSFKANLLGTVIVAFLASVTTTIVTNSFFTPERHINAQPGSPTSPVLSRTSVLSCGDQVYSPVQNTCVDQRVFDMEMQRLFAALGIDTSIYGLGPDTK